MKMLPHAHRASILAIFVIFTAALISGCKSYQFGNPTELPFDSIYIKPVTNDSFAPQAQALISSQIRDIFIHDGRTKLVTSSEAADAVLIVNLTEYKRHAAARRSVDTTMAANFSLTLSAEVSLFNQNKGEYYFQERMIQKSSNAYVEDLYASPGDSQTQGFLQSEYQAMPRLTRDLARRIADEVLNPWEPR
jgi:hypothetical protein